MYENDIGAFMALEEAKQTVWDSMLHHAGGTMHNHPQFGVFGDAPVYDFEDAGPSPPSKRMTMGQVTGNIVGRRQPPPKCNPPCKPGETCKLGTCVSNKKGGGGGGKHGGGGGGTGGGGGGFRGGGGGGGGFGRLLGPGAIGKFTPLPPVPGTTSTSGGGNPITLILIVGALGIGGYLLWSKLHKAHAVNKAIDAGEKVTE